MRALLRRAATMRDGNRRLSILAMSRSTVPAVW